MPIVSFQIPVLLDRSSEGVARWTEEVVRGLQVYLDAISTTIYGTTVPVGSAFSYPRVSANETFVDFVQPADVATEIGVGYRTIYTGTPILRPTVEIEIPAWANTLRLMLSGVKTATGGPGSEILLQFRIGGTWRTGGSDYQNETMYAYATTVAAATSANAHIFLATASPVTPEPLISVTDIFAGAPGVRPIANVNCSMYSIFADRTVLHTCGQYVGTLGDRIDAIRISVGSSYNIAAGGRITLLGAT